jgi:hypothetical protein
MPETQTLDWRERWNLFLGTGSFDNIPHPEGGYKKGDLVAGRDGITYLVKRTDKKTGQIILGLDRKPRGKEKKMDISDIRLECDIGAAEIRTGFVKIPEDRIDKIYAPPDHPPERAHPERN